jgi:hypothetical protein
LSLPPIAAYESPDKMNNVLSNLLDGGLECWLLYKGEEPVIVATFEIVEDYPSKVKSLLIYSIYSYVHIPLDLWVNLFGRIREYARSKDCRRIVAYSNVERVINLIGALGGETNWKFLWLEV